MLLIKFKQGKKGGCGVAFDSTHCSSCPVREQCPVKAGKKRHYLRFGLRALRIATRRAKEDTPAFKDTYRWRSGVESTFSEMGKKTGVKRLRVRGLATVGYCARLKTIGVNLFRATRVKRVLDTLKMTPGALYSAIYPAILSVKERLLNPWRRLSIMFHSATENAAYASKLVE
jgi:hypothetical protein